MDTSRPTLTVEGQRSTLKIASWNVQRLGHGHKDLDIVGDVIDEFDLVAVQEVMTREVVDALTSRTPGHRALLTDTPTPSEGSHREFFAFFYDPSKLDPVLNTFVPDPRDEFARDPFMACFKLVENHERLCLLTVHVVWGDRVAERKAEIVALGEAFRWAQEGDETSSWIVLGDFNRVVDSGDADEGPEDEWAELLDGRRLRAPVVLAGQETPTTLGKSSYANAFDHVYNSGHVFVSDDLADDLVEAGRFDIVQEVCGGAFDLCKKTVSDHAPVFLELRLQVR